MAALISLHDGFEIDAYEVRCTAPTRRGSLVVVQEIFGVNANMKALAHKFADDGFDVLVPAFYDRIEKGFDVPYDQDGMMKGLNAVRATPWDQVVGDLQAAINALNGPVFVTGFCWGGTVAWLASTRATGVAAASGYYGRMINMVLDEQPKAPIELHYGDRDAGIPLTMVDEVRAAHPDVPIHIWPAGHGFFSDRGHDHDPSVAAAAWAKTPAFFGAHASV
jgi:carboxymethylenebutenolidase